MQRVERWTCDQLVQILLEATLHNNLGQVVHTYVPFGTVTCRLTACTSGSAPGPMLSIEYGMAFTFTFFNFAMSHEVWHLVRFPNQIVFREPSYSLFAVSYEVFNPFIYAAMHQFAH